MKKFFIYSSMVGVTTGVIYILCKKRKSSNNVQESVENKGQVESVLRDEGIPQSTVDEMINAKSESVQNVYERHAEVAEIMKDSYFNIMEEFVDDFSDEEVSNEKDDNVDSETVSVINNLDSISDDLDDLLK